MGHLCVYKNIEMDSSFSLGNVYKEVYSFLRFECYSLVGMKRGAFVYLFIFLLVLSPPSVSAFSFDAYHSLKLLLDMFLLSLGNLEMFLLKLPISQ